MSPRTLELAGRISAHLYLRHRPPRPRVCPCRYRMAHAVTDGRGHATCPICGTAVDVVPDPLPGAVRIAEHRFGVGEARSTEAVSRVPH